MNVALLIGAGASFGSGGIDPHPPPLGDELLARLQAEFPATWGSVLTPDELAAFRAVPPDPPFERGMEMLWKNRDKRVHPLLTDMAIYFSRFVPNEEGTCYEELLLILGAANVGRVFCSLNYDCVFEQVAAGCGLVLAHVGAASRSRPTAHAEIAKPHGSCNYRTRITQQIRGSTFGSAQYDVYSPDIIPIEVMEPAEVETMYADLDGSILPMMCLYQEAKFSPVLPKTIEAIRDAWASWVAQTDVVLTIGARPVRRDHHIWDPIISSAAQVWFVGGQDEAYDELGRQVGSRLDHLGNRFDDALDEIQPRLLSR